MWSILEKLPYWVECICVEYSVETCYVYICLYNIIQLGCLNYFCPDYLSIGVSSVLKSSAINRLLLICVFKLRNISFYEIRNSQLSQGIGCSPKPGDKGLLLKSLLTYVIKMGTSS